MLSATKCRKTGGGPYCLAVVWGLLDFRLCGGAVVSDLPFVRADVRERQLGVPFVGPETLERGRGRHFEARLGANESGIGPSPRAISAMREAVARVWMYADPTSYDLRVALGDHLNAGADNIVVGEGIDGLLGCACALSLDPGDVVVMADGAYPTFAFHVRNRGAKLVSVPMHGDREDLDALLEAARAHNARVLYVSNPNNPMGTWWRHAEIEALMDFVPETTLLLLDEAYCDTAPPDACPPLRFDRANVLRLRTFSKAYGLAGARVGFALGVPELIAQFDKVRNHYGMNLVGVAGAMAALGDQTYLAEAVFEISKGRERIGLIGAASGLHAIPSATNFVALDCGAPDRADRVLNGLLEQGIFARKSGVAPLSRTVRISVSDRRALDLFEVALPRAVAQADGIGEASVLV